MATTVQPTTRERTSVPAAATPWYRDRNRQLIVAAIAVAVVGLIAWLLMTSARRKEEFAARSLNQARASLTKSGLWRDVFLAPAIQCAACFRHSAPISI